MGGGGKRVNTSAMDASIARQEEAIARQEAALAAREAELSAKEDATRRARAARGMARALLLGGSEAGTEDQPIPGAIRRNLGG
jgi:hypothetical protein